MPTLLEIAEKAPSKNNSLLDIANNAPNKQVNVVDIANQIPEKAGKKSLWQNITEPISKKVTGKSLAERANLVGSIQEKQRKLADIQALQGKPYNMLQGFLTSHPAQVAETAINFLDPTPLDVATAGVGALASKIPVKAGVTLGEVVSKIPINKRFFQNIDELGRYQNWLKATTPLSSRGIKGVTTAAKPATLPIQESPTKIYNKESKVTPDFAENINLKKYPSDVRQTISDLVIEKPELGKTPTISDSELIQRASNLKDTPTIKYLADLPEGTVEAEALKLRQGNVQSIRTALGGELTELKNKLDDTIKEGIGLHRRTAAMFGRGLRQQRLPAETQQKMAFEIDDTLKKISKDPVFSKDKELIDTVKKLRGIVVSKEFNPSAWNKVYFTWLNSILSNPFTHLVNTASNTLFAAAKLPEKFASAIWDIPLSLKTGKRTQFFGEIPAMVKGAFGKELPQGISGGSKLDFFTTPIKGRLGKFIGTPTKLLQVEDDLAKGIVGRMEFAGQKYAGKTGEELLKSVSQEQLYRTFQNDTGALAESLMFLRGKVPGLRYVIPFIKTPANLIARGLERTPLGIAKIAHRARIGGYSQEALAKDLGNLTIGTLGAGWIGLQYAKGNITGRVPSDSAQRDAFYRQGKKPNAIRIGDKWVPLDRLEPFGTSFAIIANFIQDYETSGKETNPEKIMEAFTSLGKTLINKTYLSGFTGMVNALTDPEMYGKNFVARLASGAVPQLSKFFADIKDPYYREANTVLDQLKVKIPGLSETLPAKVNVFGEPVKRDVFNVGTAKESQLEDMLAETPVGFPSKMLGGEKLSPEEYRQTVIESGILIKNMLQKVNPETFKKFPVELRERLLNNITSKARQIARMKLRMQRGFNR